MTVGIIAATVVTAGVGVYAASRQAGAAKKAAQAAKDAGDYATAAQLEMYYADLERNEPFRQAALDDLFYLSQPRRDFQLQQMGFGADVMDYNRQQMGFGMDQMDYNRIRMGFGMDQMDYQRQMMGLGLDEADYARDRMDYGRQMMQYGGAAMGKMEAFTDQPFELTDQYRIMQEEGELAISKSLGARGLQGSSTAIHSLKDFNRKLLASESDKYTDRRLGLLGQLAGYGAGAPTSGSASGLMGGAGGMAGGGAGPNFSIGNFGLSGGGYQPMSSQGVASNLGNIAQWQGAAQANAALSQGQASANMWSGLGNAAMQGYGMYQQNQQNQQWMDMSRQQQYPTSISI